jgi:cobalt-zinc-cadmium efflux system outer membrane protein
VDVAQRQYDAGNIGDAELHNQQATGNQSRLDLMRAKAEVKADRERLNRLLGLSGEQINWQIADELPSLPEKEMPLENLESLAVNQRLDLAAERKQLESIAASLRLKKNTRFIPGVAVGVDTERTPDGQRVTGPTLDLELPIFDQGQPAVAKLAAQFEQARNNYMAHEVNVRSEVRESLDALRTAREATEFSQKHLLPLRRQILRDTQLQYNAMQKGSFELLAAKEREQNSEQTNVEALRDYWLARVALERAIGGRLALPLSPMPQKSQPEPQEQEHHHE